MRRPGPGNSPSGDSSRAPGPMPLSLDCRAPARFCRLFVVAPLWTAIAACGCHSGSESTRQTRAESISPAKGDDTTLLASGSGSGGSGVVTKASGDGSSSGGGSSQSNTQSSAAASNTPSVATRLIEFLYAQVAAPTASFCRGTIRTAKMPRSTALPRRPPPTSSDCAICQAARQVETCCWRTGFEPTKMAACNRI